MSPTKHIYMCNASRCRVLELWVGLGLRGVPHLPIMPTRYMLVPRRPSATSAAAACTVQREILTKTYALVSKSCTEGSNVAATCNQWQ
jgi:hypothetical protein